MTAHLVIGSAGQVGSAVRAALEELTIDRVAGFDVSHRRPAFAGWSTFDALHVCIPGGAPEFPAAVRKYQRMVKPDVTIVYSSTPVGMCEELGAVHSPIEGQHVGDGIRRALVSQRRILGSSDPEALRKAAAIWTRSIEVTSASATEFLKLRSTTLYGLQLAFAAYAAEHVDPSLTEAYDRWYNEIYAGTDFVRPVLTPPAGPIGGHCVVPNAALLDQHAPSALARIVARFNDRFAPDVLAS